MFNTYLVVKSRCMKYSFKQYFNQLWYTLLPEKALRIVILGTTHKLRFGSIQGNLFRIQTHSLFWGVVYSKETSIKEV